ncbi:MAG TPA: CoA-binding protein [Euryarchaeota archaeon]|nr:coA binding domain protein [archaeon BMS3Bbin15]HDL15560.1 CoA-binding protein [Euryarchaeota archaeon]
MNEIERILRESRNIAVVGCSTNPAKEAHKVPLYMKMQGYKIIPVNPFAEEILGEKAYKKLEDIPGEIDIVNVFRPAEEAPGIAEEAIGKKAKVLWLQLGIYNKEAGEKAEKAGLKVIMNRCIKREHERLIGSK